MLGFGYSFIVSWLFDFLCFTLSMSFKGSYPEDEPGNTLLTPARCQGELVEYNISFCIRIVSFRSRLKCSYCAVDLRQKYYDISLIIEKRISVQRCTEV